MCLRQSRRLIESFSIRLVDGNVIGFDELAARGPVVILFFRFAGCPVCNIALPYYQRQLWPALREIGTSLLALSPQVPGKLAAIKQQHRLEFLVGSDLHNELGRRFGILYSDDEPSKQAALARNSSIGDVTGTGTWELPKPTVLVCSTDRVVRFADVSPDWLVRTEAARIVEAVKARRCLQFDRRQRDDAQENRFCTGIRSADHDLCRGNFNLRPGPLLGTIAHADP